MSGSQGIFNNDILINCIINLTVFIIVWRVLAASLFSPFSNAFEKRKELVDGQKKKAQALRARAEEIAKEYELRIIAEKAEIKKTIERIIADAEVTQRKIIQQAREVAAEELNETRKRIYEEAEKVREKLKNEVPSIAVKMASRVIGREVNL
jgi:F-type H+-transporting ATPase subunit b